MNSHNITKMNHKSIADFHQKYRMINFISEGRYCFVYSLQSEYSDNKVVKCYKTFEGLISPCMNDVYYSKLFKHKNLARIDEVYSDCYEGQVMLYCVCDNYGTTLDNLVRTRSLSIDEINSIVLQLIDALYYLHSNGYYHGDLSGSNIMVDDNLNIKIIDYGMVSTPQQGIVNLSSEHIRPPELNHEQDKHYDCRKSDMWSLGCIIYFLINRQYPLDDAEYVINNDTIKSLLTHEEERIDINKLKTLYKKNDCKEDKPYLPFNSSLTTEHKMKAVEFLRGNNILLDDAVLTLHIYYQLEHRYINYIDLCFCLALVYGRQHSYSPELLCEIIEDITEVTVSSDEFNNKLLQICCKINWNIGSYTFNNNMYLPFLSVFNGMTELLNDTVQVVSHCYSKLIEDDTTNDNIVNHIVNSDTSISDLYNRLKEIKTDDNTVIQFMKPVLGDVCGSIQMYNTFIESKIANINRIVDLFDKEIN